MSRRIALATVSLLAAAACGSTDEEVAGDALLAQGSSHVIPVAFRGRWAEDPASCLSDNARRYEIGAIHLDTAEWSTDVSGVRLDGRRALVDLEAPRGEFTFALALVDDNTIRAHYDGRPEFGLTRCRT